MAEETLGTHVVLQPPSIVDFPLKPEGGLVNVVHVTITNLAKTQNLAYKVKTTAPKNYQVKPFQGIVPASQSGVVEITLVPGPVSQLLFTPADRHLPQQVPGAGRLH